MKSLDQIPFNRSELNEVIMTVYNVLEWIIRDRGDELEVTNNNFLWRKGSKVLDSFPDLPVMPTLLYKDAVNLVLERDIDVREMLKLASRTEARDLYKVYVPVE